MKKIIIIIAIFSLVISANNTFAAETIGSSGTETIGSSNNAGTQSAPIQKLQNPLKADSVTGVIFLAVDLAVYVGIAFAILAIIYVGFMFIAAQGNEDKLNDAKKWFFYIIIGLAILISAKVIVYIVRDTLINAGVVDKEMITNLNNIKI